MSEDEAKAIVRRFFDEAWNQNRVATLDEYISTDNIHHGVSHTGPRGPEDTRQMMKRWRAAFPDVQYHIEALVAEDDVVAARTTMTATPRRSIELWLWVTYPASDRQVIPRN